MVEVKKKIILALVLSWLISILMFVLGVYIGEDIARSFYATTEDQILWLFSDITTIQIGSNLLQSNFSCQEFSYLIKNSDIGQIGSYLSLLEENLGYYNPRVLALKNLYNSELVELYFLTLKYKEECNKNITTILFFYSNEPQYLSESQTVGTYLNYITYKYYNVSIFSLEAYLTNNTLVIGLMRMYNITQIPALVINNKYIIQGNISFYEIEKYIK